MFLIGHCHLNKSREVIHVYLDTTHSGVAFVDYEKAFDSVQTQAILTSLQEQGMEDVYMDILKDIYTHSSVTVHLHKESEKIRIKRGERQGDTISPKLFTATLESMFRRLNWEKRA